VNLIRNENIVEVVSNELYGKSKEWVSWRNLFGTIVGYHSLVTKSKKSLSLSLVGRMLLQKA